MSEKAAAQDTPAAPRRKAPILIVALTLLLAGGGAGAWILMKPPVQADDVAEGVQAKPKKHTSVFVPLDPFTVNLADDGGERMAQVGVTLEVADGETETVLKARMPALRNAILLQLSASQSSELLTLAGKQRLALRVAELAGTHTGWKPPVVARPSAAGAKAGAASADRETAETAQADAPAAPARPNPVQAVHFSQFIVQ